MNIDILYNIFNLFELSKNNNKICTQHSNEIDFININLKKYNNLKFKKINEFYLTFEYNDNIINGNGVIFNSSYLYDGYIKDNLPNGYGKLEYLDNYSYIGEWISGKKNGRGLYETYNYKYNGYWKDDLKNGNGEITEDEILYLVKHKDNRIISKINMLENDIIDEDKKINNKRLRQLECLLKNKDKMIDDLKEKINNNKKEKNTIINNSFSREVIINNYKLEINNLKKQISKLEENYKSFASIKKKYNDVIKIFQESDLENRLVIQSKDLSDLQSQLNTYNSNQSTITDSNNTIINNFFYLKSIQNTIDDKLNKMENNYTTLKVNYNKLEKNNMDLNIENEKYLKKNKELELELLKLEHINDIKEDYNILKKHYQNLIKNINNDTTLCQICMQTKANTLLMPCKHLFFCNNCEISNRNITKMKKCPVCRKMYTNTIKIFV